MSNRVAFFCIASAVAFASCYAAGDGSALGHPKGAVPRKMLGPKDENQPQQLTYEGQNGYSPAGGLNGDDGGCGGYECCQGDGDGKGDHGKHDNQDDRDHHHDAYKGVNDDDDDDDEHGFGYGHDHGGDDGKKQDGKLYNEGPKCHRGDDGKHV